MTLTYPSPARLVWLNSQAESLPAGSDAASPVDEGTTARVSSKLQVLGLLSGTDAADRALADFPGNSKRREALVGSLTGCRIVNEGDRTFRQQRRDRGAFPGR